MDTSTETGPHLITGGSGRFARRVLEHVLDTGAREVIATTKTPEKLEALTARGVQVRRDDRSSGSPGLERSLEGAKRLLLISTDRKCPVQHSRHELAIRTARSLGIEHIVYTGLRDDCGSEPSQIPEALESSGVDYTLLRNNLYSDLLLTWLPAAMAAGSWFASAGSGAAGYVTRDDCARTAAAALLRGWGRQVLDVTGPATLTHSQIASLASEITDRRVRYVPLAAGELLEGLLRGGMDEGLARRWVSLDVATASGLFDVKTSTVLSFTGRAPTSVPGFLRTYKGALGQFAGRPTTRDAP